MEKEIWERSKSDTIGQKQFYLDNISNYNWKDRVQADIFSSSDKSIITKAFKFAKKGKDVNYIKENLNVDGKVNIMVQSGLYENDDKIIPKSIQPKKGLSDIVKEGDYYFFLNTKEILPSQPKDFLEARGKVINDYQQYLESHWVNELKKEVNIKVNDQVLAKIKQQLTK